MKQPTLEDIDRAQVNMETAQISWRELQPYFARGATVAVVETLDLVDVAFQISKDNKAQVAQWMESEQIGRVSDEQALAWYEADALVWAVVASPYVLVQAEKRPT
jgi:hypothetical protein